MQEHTGAKIVLVHSLVVFSSGVVVDYKNTCYVVLRVKRTKTLPVTMVTKGRTHFTLRRLFSPSFIVNKDGGVDAETLKQHVHAHRIKEPPEQ